jgi:hypothetical protein
VSGFDVMIITFDGVKRGLKKCVKKSEKNSCALPGRQVVCVSLDAKSVEAQGENARAAEENI